jgi:hypothetical protein
LFTLLIDLDGMRSRGDCRGEVGAEDDTDDELGRFTERSATSSSKIF